MTTPYLGTYVRTYRLGPVRFAYLYDGYVRVLSVEVAGVRLCLEWCKA